MDVYLRVCVPQRMQSGFLMLFIDGVDHDAAPLVPGDVPANVAPGGGISGESASCWQAHFARLATEAGAISSRVCKSHFCRPNTELI